MATATQRSSHAAAQVRLALAAWKQVPGVFEAVVAGGRQAANERGPSPFISEHPMNQAQAYRAAVVRLALAGLRSEGSR